MAARRFCPAVTILLASLAAVAGCKRGGKASPEPEAAAAGGTAGASGVARSAAPAPAGMKAPFERRTAAATKTYAAGVKAYRAGKYAEAEQLFQQAVAAWPDDTAARYQELRAAVRANPEADLREPVRALLHRDFVGYDHRLRSDKELAPLWASPRAGELEAIRASARVAYTAGLASGVFFVGRDRPGQPVPSGAHAKPALDLALEAYQFDPATGLVRRLTDTAGRVAGMRVDRAHRRLVLLVVNNLVPSEIETGLSFAEIAAEVVSLDTLETVGPIPLPVAANLKNVTLCTTATGEPRWIIGEALYTIEPAKRRAVAVKQDDCAPGATIVSPERGWVQRPRESGPDGGVVNLAVDGGSQPIKIADLVRSISFDWSPGRSRAAMTRRMDPCELAPAGWLPEKMNTLNVWEPAAGKTIRLATAFSFFEYEWLDDDHLVYEGSTPKGGKIVVHDFRTRTDAVLDVPAGAGLSAVPSFDCVMPTVETGEDPEGE